MLFSLHQHSLHNVIQTNCSKVNMLAYKWVHQAVKWTNFTTHFTVIVSPFVASIQPCQQLEEMQRGAHASSHSPSWETPMSPAPVLDAAMARCGAPLPRAMMMTANGASVLTKVWVLFVWLLWICHKSYGNECQIVWTVAGKLCTAPFVEAYLRHILNEPKIKAMVQL